MPPNPDRAFQSATSKIRQALDELARSSHRSTSTSLVGPLGFLSSRKRLMFHLLQPITNWLLIAVVLTGHLPALIHKVECGHGCAVDHAIACELKTSHGTSCFNKCCEKPQVDGPCGGGHSSVNSNHQCDDCTICQSLFSTNGFISYSGDPTDSELLQVELLFHEQVAPELTRFGFSQSRAPPGFLA